MTQTFYNAPNSAANVMTSELNSLADSTYVLSSSAYDNTTKGDLYANFQYVATYSGSTPSAGAQVANLFMLVSVDGTNYPSVDGSNQPQASTFIGTFETRNASTSVSEYLVLTGIPLPPCKLKFVVENVSGQTLASSGNFVEIQPYQIKNV